MMQILSQDELNSLDDESRLLMRNHLLSKTARNVWFKSNIMQAQVEHTLKIMQEDFKFHFMLFWSYQLHPRAVWWSWWLEHCDFLIPSYSSYRFSRKCSYRAFGELRNIIDQRLPVDCTESERDPAQHVNGVWEDKGENWHIERKVVLYIASRDFEENKCAGWKRDRLVDLKFLTFSRIIQIHRENCK